MVRIIGLGKGGHGRLIEKNVLQLFLFIYLNFYTMHPRI